MDFVELSSDETALTLKKDIHYISCPWSAFGEHIVDDDVNSSNVFTSSSSISLESFVPKTSYASDRLREVMTL